MSNCFLFCLTCLPFPRWVRSLWFAPATCSARLCDVFMYQLFLILAFTHSDASKVGISLQRWNQRSPVLKHSFFLNKLLYIMECSIIYAYSIWENRGNWKVARGPASGLLLEFSSENGNLNQKWESTQKIVYSSHETIGFLVVGASHDIESVHSTSW